MEEIVNAISDFIAQWVTDNTDISPDSKIKNWGFVELTKRESKGKKSTSEQPIPMTINGTGDREQVSLDDRYDFIEWIRWVSPVQSVINQDDSWGLKEGKRKSVPLRIVIAHKVEIGEDLIIQIAENLPELFRITGFDFVFLQSWSIDPDHETIYQIELGNTVYEQHRFGWNVYVIDLNVEYKQCLDGPAISGVELSTSGEGIIVIP